VEFVFQSQFIIKNRIFYENYQTIFRVDLIFYIP